MAYIKQGFSTGKPLKATQLEAMEDGIIEAYNLAANNGGNGEVGTGEIVHTKWGETYTVGTQDTNTIDLETNTDISDEAYIKGIVTLLNLSSQ
jgi:hypothetical protein